MKYCPNCGEPCNEDAQFCGVCGKELKWEGTADKNQKSKSLPILIGAAVLIVVMIAGTVIGVRMIKNGSEEPAAQAANSQTSARETTADKASTEAVVPDTAVTDSTQAATQETTMPVSTELLGAASEGLPDIEALSPSGEAQTTAASQDNYTTYYVVNCRESITLRKSASTSAGEYCQIPLGAAVSYVETAGNGFYKVIYNGTTGYALASYLSTSAPSSSENTGSSSRMVVVNCNVSITLRKTPSTGGEEICQIPLGAEVEFLSTAENGFYTVSYNGMTGFALASYLAPVS